MAERHTKGTDTVTTPPAELQRRALGETGLDVTALSIGTSPIGNIPGLYGYDVDEERARLTVHAVLDSPINFLDTSNGYGVAEQRIGQALREAGGVPDGFVLATKVDPAPDSSDFSGARVRASFEESLERLGLDRIQLLYLHDPERITFAEGMAADGPVEALVALKNEGLVDNIGVAGGDVDLMIDYLRTDAFDAVLNHNRYTLIDQSAEPLLDEAAARHVAMVNAAPYGGGMLVKGPDVQPKYAYRRGTDSIRDRVLAMQEICSRYDVPLAAAALQFSVREPRIASTVVGVSAAERVEQTLGLLRHPIPDELWAELRVPMRSN
jgi:D-threo-aldose 1-dehydrogenase